MHVDPSNLVLATTTFPGAGGDGLDPAGVVMPVVVDAVRGGARAGVLLPSLGHQAAELTRPQVAAILRAAAWAGRRAGAERPLQNAARGRHTYARRLNGRSPSD